MHTLLGESQVETRLPDINSSLFHPLMRDRIVFRRNTGEKALGIFVYFIAGPLIGILIATMAGFLTYALLQETLKLPNAVVVTGIVIVMGGVIYASLAWVIRVFRRRAFEEYIFTPTTIEYAQGRNRSIWQLGDIAGLCLAKSASEIAMDLASGRRVVFDSSIAQIGELLPVLLQSILPDLARRHESAIAAGQVIVVRDLGLCAIPTAIKGVFEFLHGIACLVSISHALDAKLFLSGSMTRFREAARGFRGGMRISKDGVVSMKDNTLVPWAQITDIQIDRVGLRVFSSHATPICVTQYATHFYDLCRLLHERGFFGSDAASH